MSAAMPICGSGESRVMSSVVSAVRPEALAACSKSAAFFRAAAAWAAFWRPARALSLDHFVAHLLLHLVELGRMRIGLGGERLEA